MSIELPEARIIAEQMNRELQGKCIESYQQKDHERLQRWSKIGFLNRDIRDFDQLVGGEVDSVVSRGNVIRVKLNNGMYLILSPEYGGKILYHTNKKTVPRDFNLKITFSDDTVLTVRHPGIYALKEEDLEHCYGIVQPYSYQILSSSNRIEVESTYSDCIPFLPSFFPFQEFAS